MESINWKNVKRFQGIETAWAGSQARTGSRFPSLQMRRPKKIHTRTRQLCPQTWRCQIFIDQSDEMSFSFRHQSSLKQQPSAGFGNSLVNGTLILISAAHPFKCMFLTNLKPVKREIPLDKTDFILKKRHWINNKTIFPLLLVLFMNKVYP